MDVRYLRDTSGGYVAFATAGNLFTPSCAWLGVLRGAAVYDTEGEYVGELWPDGRLVRNRTAGTQRPILRPKWPMCPVRPLPPRRGLYLPRPTYPFEDLFEGVRRPLTALTTRARLERVGALACARLIAADGRFLGVLSRDAGSEDSLGNPLGPHGSAESELSIFCERSPYGSAEGPLSAFDPAAAEPPRLERGGKTVAFLSVNPEVAERVDPNAVLAWLTMR